MKAPSSLSNSDNALIIEEFAEIVQRLVVLWKGQPLTVEQIHALSDAQRLLEKYWRKYVDGPKRL